jgi:lysosomal-associated membrane protein 1/2
VVNEQVSIRFDKLHVQPFNQLVDGTDPNTFIQGAQCSADKSESDLVPIIVGGCLALLVIVVLVAYLVGRARSKRQGYASV